MYFVTKTGTMISIRSMNIAIIVMSSLDTPASISFRFDTASVAENPICNTIVIRSNSIAKHSPKTKQFYSAVKFQKRENRINDEMHFVHGHDFSLLDTLGFRANVLTLAVNRANVNILMLGNFRMCQRSL